MPDDIEVTGMSPPETAKGSCRSALKKYFALTWFFLLLVAGVGIPTGAGYAVQHYLELFFVIVVMIITFGYKCLGCKARARDKGEASNESTPMLKDADGDQQQKKKKRRILWLDTLKVGLISMVVIGHSGVAFTGAGSFLGFAGKDTLAQLAPNFYTVAVLSGLFLIKPAIVPTFYFVSGYFSAKGLRKKGPEAFLRGSFARLGVVWILFFFAFNPLNEVLAFALARPSKAHYVYGTGSAATWFLSWLLIFNAGYALADPPAPAAGQESSPPPTFARLCKICLGVAVVQLLASIVLTIAGAPLFANMPMGPIGSGNGFFNVLGYLAGIEASNNKWLSKPLPAGLVRSSRVYTGVLAFVVVVIWVLLTGPVVSVPSPGQKNQGLFLGVAKLLELPLGPFTGAIGVVLLDSFRRHFDFSHSVTRFLGGGAFAVYLIHYFLVVLYTYTFAEVLGATQGHIKVRFTNSTQTTTVVGAGNLFGGFVYVAVLSMLTAFTIGGLMKKIPGLGKFL